MDDDGEGGSSENRYGLCGGTSAVGHLALGATLPVSIVVVDDDWFSTSSFPPLTQAFTQQCLAPIGDVQAHTRTRGQLLMP
jgi:hypothetical protein